MNLNNLVSAKFHVNAVDNDRHNEEVTEIVQAALGANLIVHVTGHRMLTEIELEDKK